MVAIRFEGDARGVVVADPSRERERREVELSRAAAGGLEVVPERPRQAVREMGVAVQRLRPTGRLSQSELPQKLDVGG